MKTVVITVDATQSKRARRSTKNFEYYMADSNYQAGELAFSLGLDRATPGERTKIVLNLDKEAALEEVAIRAKRQAGDLLMEIRFK